MWIENFSSKLGSVSLRIPGMRCEVIEESLVKRLFPKVCTGLKNTKQWMVQYSAFTGVSDTLPTLHVKGKVVGAVIRTCKK